MIRPVNFGFNAQTAVNNAFQVAGADIAAQEKAQSEFDNFVTLLRSSDIDVTVEDLLQHISANVVVNAAVLSNAIQNAGANARA